MKTHSQKFLQQRRFYMVLPMLALPFITMIFWALGGGEGTQAQAKEVKTGFNMDLPGAHFDKSDELWDKFALYEQAKRDSIKYEEARKNDPYYETGTLKGSSADTLPEDENTLNTSLGTKKKIALDPNAEEITKKIALLQQQLREPVTASQLPSPAAFAKPVAHDTSMNQDVDRLEKMMEMMSANKSEDPEMKQLDGVLEKIMDVQHPERMREKINMSRPASLSVQPAPTSDNISLVESSEAISDVRTTATDSLRIDSEEVLPRNSFFGLEGDELSPEENGNAMEAVVHGTQSVVAGSTIKMRLLSDVTVKGQTIRKDQFIYGICSVSGERLIISINSIRSENSLLPVALKVYDLDGLEGIYTPGAISRDAAKQATSQSVQEVQLSSMDNSFGMQAATAGIGAAKGMFSKKIKLVKVTVKAGYHILLKDANQKL